MTPLALHEFHAELNGRFTEVSEMEAVDDYGDWLAEHTALRQTAGVLDLSFRSRLVLTGTDRVRLLNGQVTNNVKDLPAGEGCYAALVTNKGRMQSDLNIYILPDEILLDFEPGLTAAITERFEKFIIADDVQVIDAAPHYGLISVQGPQAWTVVNRVELNFTLPEKEFQSRSIKDETLGEIYCVNRPRTGSNGFELFAPTASLAALADKLTATAKQLGGRACGWRALETARIEAGIPRFGVEMTETNLAPEAGIEARAISYTKGCYIGQETIARIRTYGQVPKALRGLRFADGSQLLPRPGDKLFFGDKEVGYVGSAIHSPTLDANIGLGYVRREHNSLGTELKVRGENGEALAAIVETPFVR
ncbi:MAG TPA: aminomethyltransferase family protein [Candidatus Limnocylindria bacterium]|nr:aminomethyltransferase family protein [Candidatus Limnocylindria bacterium]